MTVHDGSSGVLVTVVGRTHPGRTRSENQDTFVALELEEADSAGFVLGPDSQEEDGPGGARGSATGTFRPGFGGALLVVADGMGGAAGGASASRLAVDTAAEVMSGGATGNAAADPDGFAERLEEAVQRANRRIRQQAEDSPELEGMGTTFTGAGVVGGHLVVAQVGDSRGYLLRDGDLVRITRDQSLVEQMVASGAITSDEARRTPGRNVILQAVGTNEDLEVVLSHHELRRGDVLLLCSDGLCGVVDDDAIERTLLESADLEASARRLEEQANAAGGPDNITVLMARIEGGLAPSDDGSTRPHPVPPPLDGP